MSNSTLNIKLEDNTIQGVVIDQALAQQICALVNRSFMAFDPVYSKHANQVQFVQFMEKTTKYYVLQSIRQNLAYGLILKPSNKIVGVLIAFDVTTLKQVQDKKPGPQNQNQQKLWDIQNSQNQLLSILKNLKGLQKGDACQGMFLAIDPQFKNYHLGILCVAFTARRIFDMGYKIAFSINYSPVTVKLAIKYGAKILVKKKDQQQNLQFCLCQLKLQYYETFLNKYLEMQKQKTLKQIAKKPKTLTPKSKL